MKLKLNHGLKNFEINGVAIVEGFEISEDLKKDDGFMSRIQCAKDNGLLSVVEEENKEEAKPKERKTRSKKIDK